MLILTDLLLTNSDMGKKSSDKSLGVLPPDFIYSTEDEFYFGPATCEMLHYRLDLSAHHYPIPGRDIGIPGI